MRRIVAATLLGVVALAAGPGQAALAHPARHAVRARRKKQQGHIPAHCASVALKCKTHPGTQGPAGPAGATGAQGPLGAPGHGVADRIRSTGPVTSNDLAPTAVGLSPASFSQAAEQDERLLGLVTVTAPSGECEASPKEPHTGSLQGVVTIDGNSVGFFEDKGSPYAPGSVATLPILWGGASEDLATDWGAMPISSSAQTHTLTVAVTDDCNASGTTNFTVNSVAIDVLSAS